MSSPAGSKRAWPRASALLAALFAACTPAPPPSVEGLAFPVLVLFEQSGTVRHDDAADLHSMAVQRVAGSNSAPFLVDARFDIYRLERLQSVHGGLWLMANPTGSTEVTFELVREARADAAQARALILQREPRLRGGMDTDAAFRLTRATTWPAMLEAIGR
jgi:hypothetical protein